MTSELTVDVNDLECLESVEKDVPYFLYHQKSGISMPLRGMLWFPEQFLRYVEATQSERVINTYFRAKKEPQVMSKNKMPTNKQYELFIDDLWYRIDCFINKSKDICIEEDYKTCVLYMIKNIKEMNDEIFTMTHPDNNQDISNLFEKLEIHMPLEKDSTPE